MFRHFCSGVHRCGRFLSTSSTLNMPIKIGDKLPSIGLYEGTPKDSVNIAELFSNKKGVLFAVPGAFTPGCSQTHLPGYMSDYDTMIEKGVEVVACVSVNDPFVMGAWGKEHHVGDKIRMLADTTGKFTKEIGMEVDLTGPLGNIRSQRYSMVVHDGVVTALNVEPDGTGLTCSLSTNIVGQL